MFKVNILIKVSQLVHKKIGPIQSYILYESNVLCVLIFPL